MPDLFDLLGYRPVIARLSIGLDEAGDLQLVTGPPGVGKSWLVKEVGRIWQEAGGVTLVALGDPGRGASALYPFGYALDPLPKGWRAAAPAVADLGRIAEAVVGTRGAVTATVERLAGLHGSKRRRRSRFLGEPVQQALHGLEAQAKKKPMLLIADNLHWWDASSLDLLRMLVGEELRQSYSFLARFRVIAVETLHQYQPVLSSDAHAELCAAVPLRRTELGRVPRQNFRETLLALGAPGELSAGVADEIYTLSGGHLALASRAAEHLAEHGADGLRGIADSQVLQEVLLNTRLHSLGSVGQDMLALLEIASMLGLTFRQDEILCVYGGDDEQGRRLLRCCRDENVLEADQRSYWFAHDIFRQYFGGLPGIDSVSIHERLMSCLRTLQPGDYLARCLNAVKAERPTDAGALAVQAVLQLNRDSGGTLDAVPEVVRQVISDVGLHEPLQRFLEARAALMAYDFPGCLAALDRLPRGMGRTLLAEADYLRATCLMSTRSEVDRRQGRDLLRPWTGLNEEEPELGFRLMRQLLYGLAMMKDKTEARQLEHQLRVALESRAAFDPHAVDSLYTLDRCAGSLEPPDTALIRTREAVRHFAPREEEAVVRRPLEYYRCLLNYGSTLICNARYAEASAVYVRLSQLIDDHRRGTFPRVDFAYANQLLASYRNGEVTAAHAAARQQRIIEKYANMDDPFYLGNGLAIYLALDGRISESLDVYQQLHKALAKRTNPEPSMSYLMGANEAAVMFLGGEGSVLSGVWDDLKKYLDGFAYVFAPVMHRRHELLAEIIAGPVMLPEEFDRVVVSRHPDEFGPLWDNYGRGFRMPAMELWREN